MINKRSAGYLLSLPFVLYNLVFWLYPFLWTVVMGFHEWSMGSRTRTFIGFENFSAVLKEPLTWKMTSNTLYFMVVFLIGTVVCSLVLAMMINRIPFGKGIFIAGYLLSNLAAGVAYSQVFMLLMSGDGIVNKFLDLFGINILWFSDPKIAMASIALLAIWKHVGYFGLIFLAGLQAIPEEFYDAAKIDGAGVWKRFRYITIPLLNPAITSAVIFVVIWSFLVFTEPYIITGGGPSHATETFLLQIYYHTWVIGNAGYGTALTIVSAFLGLFVMVIVRRLVERRVEL